VRFYFILSLLIFINSHAQKTEKIIFQSANPFALSDIINNLDNQTEQEVYGKLTIPKDSINSDKKYPLVIGVAGSLGWREHHYEYMKMYQQSGFATFELNSFKSRNISSTVGSQVEVTTASIILDAYKAFEKLSKHPNIDKNKVSITGWSLGGAVALFSGWKPIIKAISKDLKFASHLSFYPPCFFDPENTEFTDSPIHILIGELDNWTPAEPCNYFVKKISDNSNVNLTIYPNSHHSFDSKEPITFNEKGYSFKNCLFKLNKEGDVLMNYLNLPMSSPLMQKIGFLFCVERGVNLGGNPKSREKAFAFSKSFMMRTLTDDN
tara:strand:+ start:9756 stop:10721 length:966 start_codon:yes stop_codon:yes gene_type:complete